jgi:hypothetical protein
LSDYSDKNKIEWQNASGMLRQRGSIQEIAELGQIDEYNLIEPLQWIHLFNGGNTDTPLKIYLHKSALVADQKLHIRLFHMQINNTLPSKMEKYITLQFSANDIANFSVDYPFLCIDSGSHLIYLVDKNMNADSILYNRNIVAGDFFNLPVAIEKTRDNCYYVRGYKGNNDSSLLAWVEYVYKYF